MKIDIPISDSEFGVVAPWRRYDSKKGQNKTYRGSRRVASWALQPYFSAAAAAATPVSSHHPSHTIPVMSIWSGGSAAAVGVGNMAPLSVSVAVVERGDTLVGSSGGVDSEGGRGSGGKAGDMCWCIGWRWRWPFVVVPFEHDVVLRAIINHLVQNAQ